MVVDRQARTNGLSTGPFGGVFQWFLEAFASNLDRIHLSTSQ